MAANFNPYQSIYAAKQHGLDATVEFPSQSALGSSNPAANGVSEVHYPFAHHSNQINSTIDPIETTMNIPAQSYAHHHHNHNHNHQQPMDMDGLSANQVNQAFNNMAFSSSFGDLSARSSRRSIETFSMGHHQHHSGLDLSGGHHSSNNHLHHHHHFGSNHLHQNGAHDDEYSFDVNQISDLLSDNNYFPNMCVFLSSRLRFFPSFSLVRSL